MILGGDAIRVRLDEIFPGRTHSTEPEALQEASYNLRVAWDGMVLDGKPYPPGKEYSGSSISIRPGRIAVLSTVEHFQMPGELVGHLGVRLDWASKGLTALWGIQVDPYYGEDCPEPLFLRVANFGDSAIRIDRHASVFNIEFAVVQGTKKRQGKRKPTWERVRDVQEGSFQAQLERNLAQARSSYEPVILFGVFLVAATLLGAMLTLLMGVRDTPISQVPQWVTGRGWVLIVSLIGMATFGVFLVGLSAVLSFFGFRRQRPWP